YFQCVLTRPGRLDELTVNVEAAPDAGDLDREAVAREVQHHIKSRIGTSARVHILDPGGIERSVGKARRIVDERPR
ncbi:MAG: phenylacetate--CoA ligase, partial [Oryzihumus sp.]